MELETRLSEILKHKGSHVHQIHPEATALSAARQMNEEKIGCLLVVENNKPVGIFTERDVMNRIVDAGRDAAKTKVREVMSPDLIVVKPSITVEEAMRVITEKRRRHLPVYENGVLHGIISIGDLMRWIVREQDFVVDSLLDYIQGRYPG
jgi:CBS domain-containing protein